MSRNLNRRQVLKLSALTLVETYCGKSSSSDDGISATENQGTIVSPFTIKKSLKFEMFQNNELSIEEKFKILKEIGFDGVEIESPNDLDLDDIIAARDKTGLEIPGVIDSVHWKKPLSDPDPNIREEGRAALETALYDAKAYGSTTVLLVPAVVKKGISYKDAYNRSQAEIHKTIPLAHKLGVKIAIENLWNNFLYSPLEMARYIDELESPMVGSYFDVGNVVNYGWPEQWIRILNNRIMKLDIKEYSREKRDKKGPYTGFEVPLGEGDCDWPAVIAALQEIGYNGWGSAEVKGGNRARLVEISKRMDSIFLV